MSIQQISSCIHKGTTPITIEHEGKIIDKLACDDCIEMIKSLSTYKIISS